MGIGIGDGASGLGAEVEFRVRIALRELESLSAAVSAAAGEGGKAPVAPRVAVGALRRIEGAAEALRLVLAGAPHSDWDPVPFGDDDEVTAT